MRSGRTFKMWDLERVSIGSTILGSYSGGFQGGWASSLENELLWGLFFPLGSCLAIWVSSPSTSITKRHWPLDSQQRPDLILDFQWMKANLCFMKLPHAQVYFSLLWEYILTKASWGGNVCFNLYFQSVSDGNQSENWSGCWSRNQRNSAYRLVLSGSHLVGFPL